MDRIEVVDHDPRWREAFQREAQRICSALAPEVRALHHIGSTSVPGLCAKPIIDILIECDEVSRLDAKRPAMEALGYEAMGEFGIAGRRFFQGRRADGTRTRHVHAFVAGSPELLRHLAFRDYLIANPAEASRYASLKRALAGRHPNDREAYAEGKGRFVEACERRALAWHAQQA